MKMNSLESLMIQPSVYYTVEETEAAAVADWLQASRRSLAEVWDNAEDAVYDQPRR